MIYDIYDTEKLAAISETANAALANGGDTNGVRARVVDGVMTLEIDQPDGSTLSIVYIDDDLTPEMDFEKARKMAAIIERSLDASVSGVTHLRAARTHNQASAARSALLRDREQIEIGLQALERLVDIIDMADPSKPIEALSPPSENAYACYVLLLPNTD